MNSKTHGWEESKLLQVSDFWGEMEIGQGKGKSRASNISVLFYWFVLHLFKRI